MSKHLHVLLSDEEMTDIRRLARREGLTVSDWVRRSLRHTHQQQTVSDPETKLKAIRRGAQLSFPTADVEQMLSDIDFGYQS